MFRHDYQVLTAQSADEGLEIVKAHPDVKIIFCDQRMPGKTGVQFFREVSRQFPEPVRMLITGYVDIESVIGAINEGHVYRYLTKPWQEVEVRSAIEEGYKYYTTSSMLSAKINELQEANAELDKFTYSVTHDIQGPVVSILGALRILKDLDNIHEIRNLTDMMIQSVEKVRDLITNIHEYYSVKRGNLNIVEIDFEIFLKELLFLHQVHAEIHRVSIRTDIVQAETFRSDLTVLQLIFNNLLTNAIKYYREGESQRKVEVRIRVDKGVAHIEIEDNGIGIDPRYTDSIFDMFFRATKESVGSGFGLYNVKDGLNKLNGTIAVTSEVGVGTNFVLSIPTK